jgi:glycosyltransferase involved in cell wall biosynthesis
MTIAVNTRFLLHDYLEGYGYFLYETFKRITKNHPEHEFIFIFDRPYDQRFIFSANITPVVTGPPARHPLLWKLWYDIRIPPLLKKYKADVFISCDGFCSLATPTPQCLVLHDLSFLHFPSFIPKAYWLYLKRYTPKFIDKATQIVTVSAFSKQDILSFYRIDDSKIDVVPNAARESFRPASVKEKEETKNKYSDGREYFVYTGSIHPRKNLTNLLKAFSVFKKKQKSNLKLILAGRLAWKYSSFIESLKTYRYRDDVVMTGYLPEEELARITGSAYALVYPSLWEGFGVPVLEAMRCEVPVITSSGTAMQEIAKEAALYADPGNYNDIADKMMLLYKDERLRAEMILRGKQVEKEYSWNRSAKQLWDCIMKTAVNPSVAVR